MPATLALCLVLSQLANPYAGLTWVDPLAGTLDPAVYPRIWARAVSKPPEKPAPKLGFEATDFKPAQPRSWAQSLVSQSKAIGREHGRALVEGLNAALDLFEKDMRKNNVAFAMAFLIGSALGAAGERDVADAELVSLAQAVNDELAGSPQFKKLNPKQKQLLYEGCIVGGALLGGMAAAGAEANDAELKAEARLLALTVLKTFRGK
ncbi:MAG: hypothetical protein JNK82_13080 [Myxococcaceae bacterium]|nr:hypothetical protein [Myxococcaceae bacterium]